MSLLAVFESIGGYRTSVNLPNYWQTYRGLMPQFTGTYRDGES